MKLFVKKVLNFFFNPLAKRLGYTQKSTLDTTSEADKNVLLDNFYQSLHKLGYNPKHIVDIGANHGTWTRKALEHFPDAYFTLLEPQARLKASIDDLLSSNSKVSFHAVGAGEKEGSFKFTIVDRDDSCSFRFSEEEAAKAGFEQYDVPVVTLNGLLSNKQLPIPDIIKIDAEGLDINVVKGASHFFGKTEIFMVEAAAMNKVFSNDVLTTMQFMDSIGYKLLDITDLNRTLKHNALWLVELVFIVKNGFIDNSINAYS